MAFGDVFRVRRAEQADYVAATEVLLRSRQASVPAIPPLVHLEEEAEKHFVETVMPSAEVWVVETDSPVFGVLVLEGNWIAQLHIDPDWTNHGLGTALIELAKVEHPEALELWTFESNRAAQRFYERHGFRAVGGTDGDNEEGEPDIHYRWVRGNVVSGDRVDTKRPPTGTLETVSRTTVVHNQVDEYDVYIGRAVPEHGIDDSKWGNPFVMANDSDAERERAINAYREWVVAQPELMSSLEELRSKRLGCWCAPRPCHGDVLVEILDRGPYGNERV